MPLFLLLQHTGKVFPDKRKANPVWNERLTHSLEWQSGVTSLIHCEMKAVYVWQSGRKQFLIIAVPSHIKVQIVLFTVLQTNKILHKTPFFLGKKKISWSGRYCGLSQQLFWTELPHLPSLPSVDAAGSLCRQKAFLPQRALLWLSCADVSPLSLSILPSLLPASPPSCTQSKKKGRGKSKSKTLVLSSCVRVRGEPWGFLELHQKWFSISFLHTGLHGKIWSKELGAKRKACCDLHYKLLVKLERDEMSPVNCRGKKNPFSQTIRNRVLSKTNFCHGSHAHKRTLCPPALTDMRRDVSWILRKVCSHS